MNRIVVSDEVRQLNPDLAQYFDNNRVPAIRMPQKPALDNGRSNKYGARKTQIGDLTFDSKKEANRYLELKAMEERGEIECLRMQRPITLVEGFIYAGKKVQAITYTADFVYHRDGLMVIEDVKSEATAKTEAFRLRWRLLQWHYRNTPDVKLIMT